nr:DUF3566 domain-containing protein [Umezawaea beigongshangensis]
MITRPTGADAESTKAAEEARAGTGAVPAQPPAEPAGADARGTSSPEPVPPSQPADAARDVTADRAETVDMPPPPWQRVPNDAQQTATPDGDAPPVAQSDQHTVETRVPTYPAQDPDTIAVARPVIPGAEPQTGSNRTSVNLGQSAARPGAAPSNSRRPGRGPRRASLQVKRIDPWSVLKLALVLSVALFFVWLVAVGVLYGVLNGMGVWDKINSTANDLLQGDEPTGDPLISAGRVFGVAAVIGAVNIVLFTALATVSAFVYNVSADLAGGLELTLSERE